MITTEQIKELRDRTGISVMQCKKALEEAHGDQEKALAVLKKKGAEVADKKAARNLGAGVVRAYIHANGSVGAMVELLTETDFVARNEEFSALAYDIAMHIAAMKPEFLDANAISDVAQAQARALFAEEVEKMQKPEDIKQKVMDGKLATYFGEKTLLSQPFVKNPDHTIADLIKNATQKFGEKIEVGRFACFSVLAK